MRIVQHNFICLSFYIQRVDVQKMTTCCSFTAFNEQLDRWCVSQNRLEKSHLELFGKGQTLSKNYLTGDWKNHLSITN